MIKEIKQLYDLGVRGFWFTDAQFIPSRGHIQNAKDILHSIRRLQDTVADSPIGMTTISDDTKHIDNSVGFIAISIAFIGFWHTVLIALILWRVW